MVDKTGVVNGRAVTFRYESGRTPALVCVHGAADNQHAYDRLLDALPDRARYAINLPGRAQTDGPAAQSVADMEAFLSRFIESHVRNGYLVVGHSLGGAVAIEHALRSESDDLKGLILLATGARLRVHPMIVTLFAQGEATGHLPTMPSWIHAQDADPELVAEAARRRELTPVSTGATDWRAADGFDRMQALDQIEVPVLVIGGTRDSLTPPKYAEYLAAHIPDAELVLLKDAGHMLVLEQAANVASVIEEFLAKLAP